MPALPKRVADRLAAGVKKFQPVLALAKSKDVNESDTVVLLYDLLGDVFGYEKYFEITSEFAIRGTYCDLAIKLDGKIVVLLEAKAIGSELKDAHVKQAIDYAANQGGLPFTSAASSADDPFRDPAFCSSLKYKAVYSHRFRTRAAVFQYQ